jgi:hypothetical protein
MKEIPSIPFTKKQPSGEDFFLVEVSLDTPDDPCWNEGFCIFGPWNSVMATLHQWLLANPEKLDHIYAHLYQGEAARDKRIAILDTEIKYQNEKRSQSNN